MRSKVFNIILFCLLPASAVAQYRLSGMLISSSDSAYVKDCVVYLNDDKTSAVTDSHGRFLFEDVASGTYLLHFVSIDFAYSKTEVQVTNSNTYVQMIIEPRDQTLEEVLVTDVRTEFGFTRMRSVESTGIYEGKKSEVIIPEQLVANVSTNNARQVYARVAGLNIWENDGAGLQLSIGGRGLDPNRTSNFNTRQNGYDISADALGYPESYYTPPVEAIGRIEIVRGAASLQYGTQFGGLINFRMKKPVQDKKLELVARQTAGSFGFYNSFTSAGGTVNKLSYYTFFQYKRGDGWRGNSGFENHTAYANVNYQVSEKTKVGLDVTNMGYLAQQPGGLTDDMFTQNPRQTNRERNWFKVDWNLVALHVDHKFSPASELNLRVFGLSASRNSVGFRPNRVGTVDDNSERDLIMGDFENWGAEARYLKRYSIGSIPSVILVGGRFYHGFNHSMQGPGSTGKGPDFNFVNEDVYMVHDFRYLNRNASLFAEHIFYVHEKWSLTPGLRYEFIRTNADGYFREISRDLAGNIIENTRTEESRNNPRGFLLAGVGVTFKPTPHIEIYSNLSQNYRSVTFNDMRISNSSLEIDPDMQDETGYSSDLGIRSDQTAVYSYDVSFFYLNYNNRIGERPFNDRLKRIRTNIGQAVITGVEAYSEMDVIRYFSAGEGNWSGVLFANIALIRSEYKKSERPDAEGRKVEFVPEINLKSGVRIGYKTLKASFQYTFLSDQFTDATNASASDASAVFGVIPAYSIMDVSMSYQYRRFTFEGSLNNLGNKMYFTRRATGYPGPGILPSDGRGFYVTLQVKLGAGK